MYKEKNTKLNLIFNQIFPPIFRVAKWTINYVNVCIMDTASSQVEVFSICLFSPQTDGEHKQIKNT
jgi:hypothetical protein